MKKDTISVNSTREFIVYVSRNKKAWKNIDELYYKNYDKCFDIEDEVKERMKEYEIDSKKETVESACYMKKLIALMLLDERARFFDNLEKLISSAFTKAYQYAISSTVINLDSYRVRKISPGISTDDMFSEFLCLMLTAAMYDKKVDEEDSFYNMLLNSFYSIKNIDNSMLKSVFSYENCSKNRKVIIN